MTQHLIQPVSGFVEKGEKTGRLSGLTEYRAGRDDAEEESVRGLRAEGRGASGGIGGVLPKRQQVARKVDIPIQAECCQCGTTTLKWVYPTSNETKLVVDMS